MREHVRAQTAMLLRRLAFQVSRAAESGQDAEAVHDLRVSIRRLSRCLRVFSAFYPGRSWKRIRRELAGMMQLAGAVRDRDIALLSIAEAGPARRGAVVARLETERKEAAMELMSGARLWKRSSFSRKWRGMLEL
jgi:CHAD domain-containing protein